MYIFICIFDLPYITTIEKINFILSLIFSNHVSLKFPVVKKHCIHSKHVQRICEWSNENEL